MARIRSIRPDFPEYQYLAECSRDARYLYLLLKTQSDDFGRLRADSRKLANTLFPYDEGAIAARPLINAWLADLVRNDCVVVYDVGRERYLQIIHWLDEERVDKPSASRIPEPGAGVSVTHTQLIEDSGLHNPRGFARAREDSRQSARVLEDSPPLGREGKGLEGKGMGGGAGEPSAFDLSGDPPPVGQSGKPGRAQSKLPKPYAFTPEHEKIGASILPADADVRALFEHFAAYWHSNGKLKADWIATWRVWCQNSVNRTDYPKLKPTEPTDGPKRRTGGLDWHESAGVGDPTRKGDA